MSKSKRISQLARRAHTKKKKNAEKNKIHEEVKNTHGSKLLGLFEPRQ